jgi:iron complex outermembrane receptor protein
MRTLKYFAIAMLVASFTGSAYAQDLDVAPEKEAENQLKAFDTPPEREPRSAIEEMVVTAQRKSESLQEVPIAVSAFNAESLELQQITTFSDLQFTAPNVNFTKTNFTGSNFSIRGVGSATGAASGSPGVAFHVNEAALPSPVYAAEYFDLERVEVLRGPQGTLYGQSATGGVVNVITAKPNLEEFGADVEVEYGNYNTFKVRGAVNIPLGERVALRVAGLSLQRDGMIENLYKGSDVASDSVDGRDLFSIRATISAEITDTTSAYFMWERFSENDTRARITNQRCNPTSTPQLGCDWRGNVEDMSAEGAYPQASAGNIFASYAGLTPWGNGEAVYDAQGKELYPALNPNPYQTAPDDIQARLNDDFRAVYTDMDPVYQQDNNFYLMNIDQELPAELNLNLLGGYSGGSVLSMQDYNMDVGPTFMPTAAYPQGTLPVSGPKPFDQSDENLQGIFNDQIFRWSDRVFAYDQSFGETHTWYGEGRISSDWDSMFNFLAGFNGTSEHSSGSYRVLANTLEAVAVDATPILNPQGAIPALGSPPLSGLYPSFYDNATANYDRVGLGFYTEGYVDVSPKLKITGGFRWNYDNKKVEDRSTLFNSLTAGGAVGTVPPKICLIDTDPLQAGNQPDLTCILDIPVGDSGSTLSPIGPSAPGITDFPGAQGCVDVLDAEGEPTGEQQCFLPGQQIPTYNMARVLKGSPTEATWNAFTGRFVIDYAAELPFTDETLAYFSWSRGYRPGGFNPAVNTQQPGFEGIQDEFLPEFVNAYEVGAKNSILDWGVQANLTAFFYDYKDYQISKIANRTSLNENVDAFVWGLELETMWAPPILPAALLTFNFSYLGSQVSEDFKTTDPRDPNGERHYESIGQSNPNYLGKDSIFAQPCVVDKAKFLDAYFDGRMEGVGGGGYNYFVDEPITFANVIHDGEEKRAPTLLNCGAMGAVPTGESIEGVDVTESLSTQNADGTGGGREYEYNLNGNQLPNAPEFSFSLGAQYTFPVESLGIDITPRTDFYWQSQMEGRIFNAPLDAIPSWYRWDAQLIFEDAEGRWFVRGYVKNILNDANVTGIYVSDAATANFTNVFTIEPRLFGFAVGAHL